MGANSFLPPRSQIRLAHALRQPTNVLLQRVVVPLQLLVPRLHALDLLDQGGEACLVLDCGTVVSDIP